MYIYADVLKQIKPYRVVSISSTIKRVIYLFYLFLNIAVHAQVEEFRHINSDGIVDFQVNCLFKDSKGFIWTGGSFMVQRFDGKYIKTYKTPPVVKKINDIDESLDGTLFIATSNGLYSLKRDESELKPILSKQLTEAIFTIYIDKNNIKYLGTESGLSILEKESLNSIDLKSLDFPFSQILAIEKTSKQTLWLLTPGGIISYNTLSGNKRHYPFLSKTDNSYCTSMTLVDSILYVGTKEKGIFSFNTTTFELNPFLYVGNGSVTSLSSDKKSKLYVGTGGTGVHLISIPKKKVYRSFNSNPGNAERLSSNMITSVMVDEMGILWVGSYEHLGFDYMFLEPKPFKFYSTSSFTTKNIPINQFYIGKGFKLLTSLNGIYYISEKTGELKFLEAGVGDAKNLEPVNFKTITPFDDKIVMGGENGIYAFDKSGMSVDVFDPMSILDDAVIFFMTVSNKGDLWIASSNGLYILSRATGKVKVYNTSNTNLPDDAISFIYFDSKNRIWICTDKGICFWDETLNDFTMGDFPKGFIDKERVHHILEDKKGNFIFCYKDRNVLFSDSDFSHFRNVCTEVDAGFTGLRILKTLQHQSGNFWFIGSRGAFWANEELTKFELYSISEGLSEPYATDGHLDGEGRLWLSNIKGLYHSTGNFDKLNTPMAVTDFIVNGNSIINEVYNGIENGKTIDLKWKQNNIKIQFAKLEYTRPDLMVYECKLSGIDDWWVILRGLNSVQYKDLKPGKYTFEVRHNMDIKSTKEIHFEIKPLLSLTECILLVVLIIGLSWYLIIKLKKIYFSSKQQEKNKTDEQKYQYNKISQEKAEEIISRLEICMKNKKMYLNENLNMSDLAKEVECSNQILSQVFNLFLNEKYNEYINRYRVNEFKRIISSTDYSKYTLKSLAQKSGFSSYTSFYRAFKEQTGITPNDFIKNN